MYGFVLLLHVTAASVITLQIIGEPLISVHNSGGTIYVPDAAPVSVLACLVFGWQNLTRFRHTDKCSAVSLDCRCYHWVNIQSNQDCVVVPLVGNTEINIGYRLLQRPNVSVLPASAIIQYGVLSRRWPNYQFEKFAAAVCGHANVGIVPNIKTLFHTINVIKIVARTTVPDPISTVTLVIFVYGFVVLLLFMHHTGVFKSDF